MDAFRLLKPTCVGLMSLAAQPPTPTSRHAHLLATLRQTLETLSAAAFTPSLINYTLFPLTNVLRQSDPAALPEPFLEAAFAVLAFVVRAWRTVEGGIDVGAWEQLWRFTAAVLARGGKGKQREMDHEVVLQAVKVLSALLEPADGVPTPAMRQLTNGRTARLLPTLFQSISTLLDTTTLPHLELQLATLRLVRALVPTYLTGQPELLASILPGAISAMAKLLATSVKGDVAHEAAGLIEVVVVETLNDEALRSLGVLRPVFDDLSQFAEWDTETKKEPPRPHGDPFPPLTASYLEFTSAQLFKTLPPILSNLTSHAVPTARTAAASLAHALILRCHEALPDLVGPAVSTLLLLSTDTFDPVRHDARRRLRLLASEYALYPALVDILTASINALPRLILSQQDDRVVLCTRTIEAIAIATRELADNPIAAFLGPAGAVERWGWALLDCLEFGRPTGWSVAPATTRGWEQRLITSTLPSAAPFPHIPLRHVESASTVRNIVAMLSALGAAGGDPALYTVDYFIRFARANRARPAKAVSAVWIAEKLLAGVATRSAGKATRKMARDVARILVAMDDDDDADTDNMPPEPESDALPIERKQGIDTLTTLLDRKPPSSQTVATRRLHAQAQLILLRAVSLSALCTCSAILGTAFRPLLRQTLYPVLAHLASPSDLVQEFAGLALVRIAYDCGYASPQNLVLDNVDHVINVVSQRLTYHRLSAHAPLVLIAMVRLVGDDIIPLVHDVVDDIFDALDDYHGYDALASALLAVLGTLMDAMAAGVEADGPSLERQQRMDDMSRIAAPPDPQADFARFSSWFQERATRDRQHVETMLALQSAWGEESEEPPADLSTDPPAASDDAEPTPTRSQAVCRSILAKSLFFLTHASPFLRARVLALAARAVPVLAAGNRDADLLALVDRHWGALVARLDDAPPVVAEAAGVVAALAEHVGDFMARRVLDHAWPRFKVILRRQAEEDAQSALARRAVGTDTPHSVSHRTHVAVLRAAAAVAATVPVDDAVLWDMMVAFRVFLDVAAHDEIQARACALFIALGRRDADAVWVVLQASRGRLEGDHVWGYLSAPGLDMGRNADDILASL
ncbi:hypothetical protein Q5752_004125 [Cryptotrichosporon argae]